MADAPQRYRYVLVPGRHQLITRFQEEYLTQVVTTSPYRTLDGAPCDAIGATLVFAITSADHAHTRRNPVPLVRRVQMIERAHWGAGALPLIFPIDDVPPTDRFARHVIASIADQGGATLTPNDTVIACSTPEVAELYRRMGFCVLGLEIDPVAVAAHGGSITRVGDCLAPIGMHGAIPAELHDIVSASTHGVFTDYRVAEMVQTVYADPLGSDEGEITTTRDYRTYAEAFDHSAARKFHQLRPHIRPGRIVDIGCGAGSLMEHLAAATELRDSDLLGIEAARPLYEECLHRRRQGAFSGNANVFFHRRNILSESIFPDGTIDTTITVALTHEIASYLGLDALRALIRRVYQQTRPGGVWLNLDVVGPAHGNDRAGFLLHPTPDIQALFDAPGGIDGIGPVDLQTAEDVPATLQAMSAYQRLLQFAQDWNPDALPLTDADRSVTASRRFSSRESGIYVNASLRLIMEWLSRDAYADNWLSEMHESFGFWSAADWMAELRSAGFQLEDGSGGYANGWLIENRYAPLGTLDEPHARWPDTHIFTIARKPR